jgi:hypothetical protein
VRLYGGGNPASWAGGWRTSQWGEEGSGGKQAELLHVRELARNVVAATSLPIFLMAFMMFCSDSEHTEKQKTKISEDSRQNGSSIYSSADDKCLLEPRMAVINSRELRSSHERENNMETPIGDIFE